MLNTGTYDLQVETNGGHTCNFNKGQRENLKRARTDTCTRDFEKKKSIAFEYAGARDDWWEESRSSYPWCYHDDGTFWTAEWDWCYGML